jgi:hypothetical protein
MKKLFVLFVVTMSICAWGILSHAYTVSFGDGSIYWPGWDNGTSDDSNDTIGVPNFLGGQVTIDADGWLESIEFTFEDPWGTDELWQKIAPADLFLDIGADNEWDYLVHINWTAGTHNNDPASYNGNYNIYDVNGLALDSGSYVFSGSDDSGFWEGYLIRDDHPIGYDPSGDAIPETAELSGWGGTVVTFGFDEFAINITETFAIGWGVNCANDVIYEIVDPIPEPTTLLLLGSGLIGLFILGRKRFFK